MPILYLSEKEKSRENFNPRIRNLNMTELFEPSISKEKFDYNLKIITREEDIYMVKYIKNFIINKYVTAMRTRYRISVDASGIKSLFKIVSSPNYKIFEENEYETGTFMNLLTLKLPKSNAAAMRVLKLKYRKEAEEGYMTPDFWYGVIEDTSNMRIKELLPHLSYYFILMCLVDVINTFSEHDPTEVIYKSNMNSFITNAFEPDCNSKTLGGFESFINFFTFNKEIEYGIKLIKKIIPSSEKN